MTGLASARAPFLNTLYWIVLAVCVVSMAFFLDRMIGISAEEEETYSMATISEYEQQIETRKTLRRGEYLEAYAEIPDTDTATNY